MQEETKRYQVIKMKFKVQKAVLDSGVKIVFAVIENMDNHGVNDE